MKQLFNSNQQYAGEQIKNPKQNSIESVTRDFEIKNNIKPYTEEQIENVLKPSGHMKINPIISIKNANPNFPTLINQSTGEAANIQTYFGYSYEESRIRAENLKNKEGLEYSILENKDTDYKEKLDIIDSSMENMDASVTILLAEDLASAFSSATCAIEGKIIHFLENLCIETSKPNSICCPGSSELNGLFSYRYPNRNINPLKVTAASFFDFIVNRKVQLMYHYCIEVYLFLRKIAYDPYLQGSEDAFDTRDTLYATLCSIIYNDLKCLDDTLAAIITQHCLRLDKNKNIASEMRDNFKIEENK